MRTECPACRARYDVPDAAAGRSVTCKTCGSEFSAVAVREDYSAAEPAAPPPPTYYPPPRPPVAAYAPPVASAHPVRPGGFVCPFCGTNAPPYVEQRISTGGWVVFAVLAFTCLPLCWIGLLMKEDYRLCSGCGMKFG